MLESRIWPLQDADVLIRTGGSESFQPFTSAPKVRWTKKQCAFAVEAYFPNGHFNIPELVFLLGNRLLREKTFRSTDNVEKRTSKERCSKVVGFAIFSELSSVAGLHSPDIAPCDYFLWKYLKFCTLTDLCTTKGEYSPRNRKHTHSYAEKSRLTHHSSGKRDLQ